MKNNLLNTFLNKKNDKKIIQIILKSDPEYFKKLKSINNEFEDFFFGIGDNLIDLGIYTGIDFALLLLNGDPICNRSFENLDINKILEEV